LIRLTGKASGHIPAPALLSSRNIFIRTLHCETYDRCPSAESDQPTYGRRPAGARPWCPGAFDHLADHSVMSLIFMRGAPISAHRVKPAKIRCMKFRSLIVAALLLAGCASQRSSGLSDTNSQINKNRDRDLYECEREAAFAGAGGKSQVFDNCMKARGYTQK
jgi:hypothetical protein